MFLSPVTRGFTTSCLRRSRIGPLSFSASGIPIIGSLNCRFAGSITGGIEGIQAKIPAMNRKLLGKFSLLVSEYAFSGILSPRIIREFRKPLPSQPPAEAETEYMNNTFLHHRVLKPDKKIAAPWSFSGNKLHIYTLRLVP